MLSPGSKISGRRRPLTPSQKLKIYRTWRAFPVWCDLIKRGLTDGIFSAMKLQLFIPLVPSVILLIPGEVFFLAGEFAPLSHITRGGGGGGAGQ